MANECDTRNKMTHQIQPNEADVLLLVDVQRDFCAGGALAVPDGDDIVPIVNRLARSFANVILTQDWHPADHQSFASQHPGKKPFDEIDMPYGAQTLWPGHCRQGTPGAEFHPDLDVPGAQLVVRKGFRREIDSYSAFFENDHVTPTGLSGYLKTRRLARIFVAGLATDFCVRYTAIDARKEGFEVVLIEDACRGLDQGGSLDAAMIAMKESGVRRVLSPLFA